MKKLILLSHYLYPYLSILTTKENGSYNYSDSWFYIDLFSGPGASNVKEYKFEILGSPIISLLKGVHYIKKRGGYIRFTKWFFIEKRGKRYDALEKRVNIALEEIKLKYEFPIPNSDVIIHPGDCNKKIDSILEEIENYKRPSILLFADPEGITEIEWQLFQILETPFLYFLISSLVFNSPPRIFCITFSWSARFLISNISLYLSQLICRYKSSF